MIEKKNFGRVSPLLLVLLALGFFFATYNLLSMIMHNKAYGSENWLGDGLELSGVTGTPLEMRKAGSSHSKFHVALTATDAPYSQWQTRIMYYWYRKVKDLPGSDMGKFTRVLHSGKPDNLMEEIPTFVVNPLPEGLDRIHSNGRARPHICESFAKLSTGKPSSWVLFFYIKPAEHKDIIRKFYPEEKGPVSDIDPIGNSPVIIKKSLLEEISPTWMNISLRMKDDPATDKAFGWVLEMYAYAVASALHGVRHILHKDFMVQPPWDLEVGKSFIIHYTYGCDYTLKGKLTYGKIGEWRFDKRSYLSGPPPRNLSLPPPEVPETVVRLVKMVNEATANIPNWDTLNRG